MSNISFPPPSPLPQCYPLPTSAPALRKGGASRRNIHFLDTARVYQLATRRIRFLDVLGHVPGMLGVWLGRSLVDCCWTLICLFSFHGPSVCLGYLPLAHMVRFNKFALGTKKQLSLSLSLSFDLVPAPVPVRRSIQPATAATCGTCMQPAVCGGVAKPQSVASSVRSGAIRIAPGRDIGRNGLVQRRSTRMRCGCSTEPSRW